MTNKTENYDLSTPAGVANSVAWLNSFISRIKEGGVWLVPRSGSAYEVRHKDKVAVKLMQARPDPSLDKVFRAAGWKVVDNS